MGASAGTRAQRSNASPSPMGSPSAIPAADSRSVVSAPLKIDSTSAELMARSELRRERHRQVEGLAELLLLQSCPGTVGFLLDDQVVYVPEQVGIALLDRPGRDGRGGDRLP